MTGRLFQRDAACVCWPHLKGWAQDNPESSSNSFWNWASHCQKLQGSDKYRHCLFFGSKKQKRLVLLQDRSYRITRSKCFALDERNARCYPGVTQGPSRYTYLRSQILQISQPKSYEYAQQSNHICAKTKALMPRKEWNISLLVKNYYMIRLHL